MVGNPNEEVAQEFQNELNRLAKKALATGTKHIKENIVELIEASRQFGYDTTDLVSAVKSKDETQVRQSILHIYEDTSDYANAGKGVIEGIQRDCNLCQNEVVESLENDRAGNIDEKLVTFDNDLTTNQEVVKTSSEALQQQLDETKKELAELKEWKENRLPEKTKRAVNTALDNATVVVEKVNDSINNAFDKAKDFVKSMGDEIKEKGKVAVNSIKKGWLDTRIGFKKASKALSKITKKVDEVGLKFAQLLVKGAQSIERDHQRYLDVDNHNIKRKDDGIEELEAAKEALEM